MTHLVLEGIRVGTGLLPMILCQFTELIVLKQWIPRTPADSHTAPVPLDAIPADIPPWTTTKLKHLKWCDRGDIERYASDLARYCPNLVTLYLEQDLFRIDPHSTSKTLTRAVELISAGCNNLRHLILSEISYTEDAPGVSAVTDRSFEYPPIALAHGLSTLIQDIFRPIDMRLFAELLVRHQNSLTTVTNYDMFQEDDIMLQLPSTLKSLPKLKRFDMDGVPAELLEHIVSIAPELRRLDVSQTVSLTEGLRRAIIRHPRLRLVSFNMGGESNRDQVCLSLINDWAQLGDDASIRAIYMDDDRCHDPLYLNRVLGALGNMRTLESLVLPMTQAANPLSERSSYRDAIYAFAKNAIHSGLINHLKYLCLHENPFQTEDEIRSFLKGIVNSEESNPYQSRPQ